jgi:hypothetical protein
MNKKLIFSILLGACLLTVVTVVAFAQTTPSVRWEYMRLDANNFGYLRDNDIVSANQLGTQGWEYVSSHGKDMVFKRRLP